MNAIRHCICLPVIIFILGELHFTSGLFAADNSERKVEGNEIFNGRVLITGAAGFIGFHLSKRLKDSFQLSADGTVVVGMDNFSPSYDVTLKEARALELKKSGVDLHRASVCEEDYVRFLFEKHDFTHVVHLAAEPGVRHSLEDPSDYIPNISCFAVLLDVVKDYSGVSVLLASSSTVYGSPGPVPFSVSHSYPDPQNMYALSKKTNEMFAESYCHEYMIQSIVLRFFTVYGPWGRPDMAVYKFTQQLYEGKPLNVSLWTSDRRPVMRDFTYIDDVIDGVVMAMKYRPKLCGETFNMGFGSPVSMATMLHHLEEEMGIKGNVVEVPLNPAELPITHSDNTESKEKLGFEPKVSLTNGLHRFVLWFRQYSQTRDASSKDPQANLEMKELTERSNKIRNKLIAAAVTKDNKVYKKRLKGLQQTFINYAKTENIPLPKLEKKGFIFYPGVVAKGTQVAHSPSLANNAKALAKKCSEVEVCVGFSPDGYLFSDFDKREKWSKVKENEGGLYVADVDMCISDLHHCPKHSTCVHEGPASYRCECEEGYATSQCIPMYVSVWRVRLISCQ
jgi:UDP-glucuronate 4-epimerase